VTAQAGGLPQEDTDVLALARNGTLAGQWSLVSAESSAEFANRHFWNTITVRGRFGQISGEGTVAPDGTVTGQLVIDAASLTTGNKQRDKHLRSADFFDVAKHPRVVLSIRRATLSEAGTLNAEGTLEASGAAEPVSFTADVVTASSDRVTLRAQLAIDRSRFGMTWSPLRISSLQATGSVTATFTRATTG
jgi:polyisoprenoid-binding protein YceI